MAGMLLLITKSEKKSFWLLVEILERLVPGKLSIMYSCTPGLSYPCDMERNFKGIGSGDVKTSFEKRYLTVLLISHITEIFCYFSQNEGAIMVMDA